MINLNSSWQAILSTHSGEKIALSNNTGGHLSYACLVNEVQSLSAQLNSRGISDCALFLDNSPAWVVSDLALLDANIACVPVPGFFSHQQCMHLVRSTGCRWLLTDTPDTGGIFVADSKPVEIANILSRSIYLIQLPDSGPRPYMPTDTVKVSFTSGSTGTPKGLCYSKENIMSAAKSIALCLEQADTALASGTHLSVLPLALLLENVAGVYAALLSGAQCVLPSLRETGVLGASGVDGALLSACLSHSSATSCILVPEIVQALLSLPQRSREFTDLKYVAVGGAPIQESAIRRCHEVGLPVFQGYGLSEACSVVAFNLPGRQRVNSVGMALPNQQVAIADDGEILLRDPGFIGYVGIEKPPTRPFPTGDIGYVDSEGYLYFKGRKNTIISTSMGRNIAPEWIESLLVSEAGIVNAFVCQNQSGGLVALIEGSDVTKSIDEMIQTVNATLPDYARLCHWHSVGSFAENNLQGNTGKLDRTAIKSHYASIINKPTVSELPDEQVSIYHA